MPRALPEDSLPPAREPVPYTLPPSVRKRA